MLLQSAAANPNSGDIFNSAAGNQFRLQPAAAAAAAAQSAAQFAAGNTPGGGHNSSAAAAAVQLLSQQLGSSLKTGGPPPPSSQIGPIGTKGNNSFQQSGLGTLPSSGPSGSQLLIPYDGSGNPMNYLPPAAALAQRAPQQQQTSTAFYQALAASSQMGANKQQFNHLQGFPSGEKDTAIGTSIEDCNYFPRMICTAQL